MSKAELTALAARLEEYLGDPRAQGSRMPYTAILDLDERGKYPMAFINQLTRWGARDYCLPASHGGRAGNVETGFTVMRLVARRDGATTIALALTSLAFMPVWIGGTDEQKRRLVADVKQGLSLSWGLSEREHGSDLLGNELVAEKADGGYYLTGRKWPIGNATVADKMAVFARTGERPGPGAFSIFILDKWRADPGTIQELPVEKLYGLRGLDLGGLTMERAFVPESARVGAEGRGLEFALKTSQTARVVILSLALSAADTALRTSLDFCEERVLLGTTVADVPYTRRQLVESFADVMVADAVVLGALRSLQAAPEQVSVWSSVAKYLVPTLLEATLSRLNMVLGARVFLREHPRHGIQQKMTRDLLVTNIADGNTVVNLRNLGHQLDSLLTTAAHADAPARAAAVERAAVLFGMDTGLPVYEPWRQELFSRGRDDAVLAAPDGVDRLRSLAEDAKPAERAWLLHAADLAAELLGLTSVLAERSAYLKEQLGARGHAQSAELFDLAKQYCLAHAAAACVLTFVHSHDVLDDPLPSGALLLLQLERLRQQLHPYEQVTDQSVVDEAMRVLRHLHRGNRLFSHWQFPLAGGPTEDSLS